MYVMHRIAGLYNHDKIGLRLELLVITWFYHWYDHHDIFKSLVTTNNASYIAVASPYMDTAALLDYPTQNANTDKYGFFVAGS